MKFYWIVFLVFWTLIIIFPDLIWILIGSFLIFIWFNMLFLGSIMWTNKNNFFNKNQWYTQWWKYKIFK